MSPRRRVGPDQVIDAVACIAAATGSAVAGLPGAEAAAPDRPPVPGLPWVGCSVLTADSDRLAALSEKARSADGVYVAEMPEAAQATRVYGEYLRMAEQGERMRSLAVSVLGPRNRVDKLTKGLALLS